MSIPAISSAMKRPMPSFAARIRKSTRPESSTFGPGAIKRAWVKNVVAIGNSSGFVEPLEATSLAAIAGQCQSLAETLAECDQGVHPSQRRQFNRRNATSWDQIRRFLAVHFKFNDRLETPYWQGCRNDAELQDAEEFVAYYREMGPSVLWRKTILDPSDQFGMEGYLSMLVGQQVPYDYKFEPTAQERASWQKIQQAIKNRVATAFTVREGLSMVRSPQWQWPNGLYRTNLASMSV